MGVLFAATGNVMAPIITHALYDWVALWITRRAIEARSRA
jgi:membrane protease YdiL (CAAX protease family)